MSWRIQYSKNYLDNITYEYEEHWSVTNSEPEDYQPGKRWVTCYSLIDAEWLLDILERTEPHGS